MSKITHSITHLKASLAAPIGKSFNLDNHPDVIAQLLADKRSPNTRRAYLKDINDFFKMVADVDSPSRDLVLEFLHLQQAQAVQLVLSYKAKLIDRGLAEATVNRRLAAIKSLASVGRKIGVCHYTLEDIKGEKLKAYRDTSGIDKETFVKVLATCELDTVKGIRDYALLRLLWGNALRRGEVSPTNIADYDREASTLSILGKGKGSQRETISLPSSTAIAMNEWLAARGKFNPDDPLFIALDNANYGHRLTGGAIYWIVSQTCKKAGVKKVMSPHRVRHSSITTALDATDGNIRKVQKLSRHANINTLMIYDDNRSNAQGEISQMLDDLV